MISVVGIGPGNPDYVVPKALRRIEQAEILIGGKRHLELFSRLPAQKLSWEKAEEARELFTPGKRVVILASGDPGIFGILDTILSWVGREEIEVIPGVSVVQYMLAQLRLPAKDLVVLSVHGRMMNFVEVVRHHTLVAIFTDREHTPQFVAGKLLACGVEDGEVYVGECLSYPEERITRFTVAELAREKRDFALNLVVIRRCGNLDRESPIRFLCGERCP